MGGDTPFAPLLIGCGLLAFGPSVALGRKCETFGTYDGSEDSTLWRHGLALQSSGLERPSRYPVSNQTGAILGVELDPASLPRVRRLNISGLPQDLDFRPHGLHLDNATQRLYASEQHERAEQVQRERQG